MNIIANYLFHGKLNRGRLNLKMKGGQITNYMQVGFIYIYQVAQKLQKTL